MKREINVAAQDGIADIEAGRFELISGPDDMTRLQVELTAILDCVEKQHRLASG